MNFRDVATVNFQGLVIAFARGDQPTAPPDEGRIATNLYFNVLALETDSASDASDWSGFQPLTLPDAVRPAGMNMINVPVTWSRDRAIDGLEDADQPFRVVTNQEYVYLFRQARKGTLLVNRLRLVRQAAADNPQEIGFTLEPAWEVRFQRSGKPDVPADPRDAQSYLSPDRVPFLEPAFELFMVDGLVDGNFAVELLPRNEGTLLTCAVIVGRNADNRVDGYELRLDAAGLFSLGDKTHVDGRIGPDFSYGLVDAAGTPLVLHGRPASTLYLKQERVRGSDGSSFTVKRSGRVMIAHKATCGASPATLATVDLAIGTDGRLARPAAALKVDPVGVANYTLVFDPGTYVDLPHWAPKQHYSVELSLYPRAPDLAVQQVLGPIHDTDAPYLRLVDGNAIEVGFNGKNGKPYSARTAPGTVRQEAWTQVKVSFDAKATPRYTISLNGSNVALDEQGEGDHPSAGQIDAIGAPQQGFIGYVDQVMAYDGAGWDPKTLVGSFPFDTIDYTDNNQQPLDPPLTPNSHDPAAPGKVHGARLLPSTSPAAVAAGALSWDARGLSIYAAYFDGLEEYTELQSSPALLAGSDGLLHCYFQGSSDAFSVMQLDTETARATYEARWTTAAGSEEQGRLQFVSAQPGAFMNDASVTLAPAATRAASFCDITFSVPTGQLEHWKGVPRSVQVLADVLAGNTVTDPADARLRTGACSYFDATGTRPAVYLPLPGSPLLADISVISRDIAQLPLQSVAITEAGTDKVDVTFAFTPLRWNGKTLTVNWPAVPRRLGLFLDTLAGLSTRYDYRSGSANIASYSLVASSGPASASRVLVLLEPNSGDLKTLAISAVADDDLLCDVAITQDAKTATWIRVPRAQGSFTRVLEGTAAKDEYDYATLASGDYAAIGKALIISTDGSDALLQDVHLGGDTPPVSDVDLRASSGLLAIFASAAYPAATDVPITPTAVTASTFQSARDAQDKPLLAGSALFRAIPYSLPNQGAAGVVQDTAAFTDGVAPLTLQGFNGGWLNAPGQRTLGYRPDSWVQFEVDPVKVPGIEALTIEGDMSLELWAHPDRAAADDLQPFQRLLTFARTAPGSSTPVRFLAALNDSPSVRFTADTRVRASFNTSAGTLYTWLCADGKAGDPVPAGVVGAIASLGAVHPMLELKTDANGHLSVSCPLDAGTPAIVSKAALQAGTWYQTAVTFGMKEEQSGSNVTYTFTAQLYLDGMSQGSASFKATVPVTNPIELATLVFGDLAGGATLPMRLNETAFFGSALDTDAIEIYNGQRIPDNAAHLVLKWMFNEGVNTTAINSSALGSEFNVAIQPTATWSGDGLYSVPVLGHGDSVAVLNADPIIHGWAHLALVHQAGHAVTLNGADHGDGGRDDTLNLADSFSLEAWVEPATPTAFGAQTVLAKGDDYVLQLDGKRRPVFSVRVTIDDKEQVLSITGSTALANGRAAYLAASFEVITVQDGDASKATTPQYEVHMFLYVDGVEAASGIKDGKTYTRYKDPVQRVLSRSAFNLGRSPLLGGSSWLTGRLADVRLWARCLGAAEVAAVKANRRVPANADGLVAWWPFNETGGRVAFDAKGDNDVRLSRGDLRGLFAATTTNAYYVNGNAATTPTYLDDANAIGGYGKGDGFRLAGLPGDDSAGVHGQLADIRIWATQRTGEQIADSMHRPLSGSEAHLRGYWSFANGSGAAVEDRTGRGNVGQLAGKGSALPTWLTSTAPLGNEAPEVINVLGGVPTFAQLDITETPAVVEYADLQRDAYGDVFSVMKRAYLGIAHQELLLITGYKIGDLDTVYLGQAQSKPTLVGYIEGAPPIPSENQTLPYWRGGYGELNSYAGATSVEFTEADNTVYAYNASRDVADTHAFSFKGGLYGGGQYSTSAGIGVEAENPILAFETHLGRQLGISVTEHNSQGIGIQNGTTQTLATGFQPGGAWETGSSPEQWVNPVVGRRYIPSNNGVALVKSLTVDLYASILRSTGSMVKMTMTPNTDIPVDVNLIDFPIDASYTKNGTLDGKVGLRNDPSYLSADLERGSYFKPLEAYAIKRRIERDTARLEAYYQQYDPSSTASKIKSSSGYDNYRNLVRDTSAYDWSQHLSKRSIVNTYVWTAGGGRHADQTSNMNVLSEQHGAIASSSISDGAVGDVQIGFPFGFYLDFDYLYTSATEVSSIKSREEGDDFALTASSSPDAWLHAPIFNGDEVTFAESPTEGKVDGYRYQAFMLAPDTEHASTFFNQVVDPNWLANSKDSNAAALREASSTNTGPWRVMYRVTYVSRIPPRFQPVPAETQAPDEQPPANLDYNALLVQLVRANLKGIQAPTPLQVGAAVSSVIGTAAEPGQLQASLPWWSQFLTDSTDFALPAAGILRALREDLLQYVLSDYACEEK
ncbi:LamG-like jellyroll fold domain-containing protein [Stenotrophomonas sp. AB1(2024)]|uniref:LamG-like jellyroll fold domain-containing protein n=1 Tax=Stenotrophomonas sp. AB1(2024) TaxID=3132215 RepID=UPI0030A20DD6